MLVNFALIKIFVFAEKRKKQASESKLLLHDSLHKASASMEAEIFSYEMNIPSVSSLPSPNPPPSDSSGYQSGSEDFDENAVASEEMSISEDNGLFDDAVENLLKNPTIMDALNNINLDIDNIFSPNDIMDGSMDTMSFSPHDISENNIDTVATSPHDITESSIGTVATSPHDITENSIDTVATSPHNITENSIDTVNTSARDITTNSIDTITTSPHDIIGDKLDTLPSDDINLNSKFLNFNIFFSI